jgi:prepilin-type N-terminal cleavage/methylation domain-containing protein
MVRNRHVSSARCGFSLLELLIVIAVILTIAAIAIPNLLRARMQANETSAAAALRSIATVQMQYITTYQQGYAPSLAALGPGSPPSAAAADLIDQVLASGTKTGYTFTYSATDTNGDGITDAFTCNAAPITPGQTGQKYFYVDQTNVIRYNLTGPAGPSDPPIPT